MLNTISEEYLNLQKDLHLRPDYGTASIGMASEVKKIFEENKFNIMLNRLKVLVQKK